MIWFFKVFALLVLVVAQKVEGSSEWINEDVNGRNHDHASKQKYEGDSQPSDLTKPSRYAVHGETVDPIKRTPIVGVFETEGERSKMQFINGWNSAGENVTREGEWNIQRQEKHVEGSKEVLETQHATCQVTTEELVATAQATVTRVLKGLCNSKEMEKRFRDLEVLLEAHNSALRTMIVNLEDRLTDQAELLSQGQKQLAGSISKSCEAQGGSISEVDRRSSRITQENAGKAKPEIENDFPELEETGIRDSEILKYNSSIHMEPNMNGPPKKVFTYYWKIGQMQYKLAGWSPRRSLRSQSFYVFPSGYRMYLRIFPRQNEENFSIHVGVTKGDFDDSLKWPFPLKHRVHILDQTKEGRTFEDITSRVWDPNQLCSEFNWQKPTRGDNYECVGLGFPHDVLRQREYIRGHNIVIKLTVYLES